LVFATDGLKGQQILTDIILQGGEPFFPAERAGLDHAVRVYIEELISGSYTAKAATVIGVVCDDWIFLSCPGMHHGGIEFFQRPDFIPAQQHIFSFKVPFSAGFQKLEE
jgi:hypothetical protein